MKRTDKSHIGERMRSSLANGGRAAGMGILYDKYDEESGCPKYSHGSIRVKFPSDSLTPEEAKSLNGEVITYKAKDAGKGRTSL